MILENEKRISRKEINLIPLVNIIFLLLTFFIIAGTIEKVDPFAINLPNASKKGDGKSQKATIIYITTGGNVAINGDLVSRKDFNTIINAMILENKDIEITIKSDANVKSSHLIWVMRELESIGSRDISIVTKVAKHNVK